MFRTTVDLRVARGQGRDVADGLTVINIEKGSGERSEGGNEIVDEADFRQTQGVIPKAEREYRGQAQKKDDFSPLPADRLVDHHGRLGLGQCRSRVEGEGREADERVSQRGVIEPVDAGGADLLLCDVDRHGERLDHR